LSRETEATTRPDQASARTFSSRIGVPAGSSLARAPAARRLNRRSASQAGRQVSGASMPSMRTLISERIVGQIATDASKVSPSTIRASSPE
jgi:hypothetical protein